MWQLTLRRWGVATVLKRRALPIWSAWLGAILLAVGFTAHLAFVEYAAFHDQLNDDAWLAKLPMHLAFHGPALGTNAHLIVESGIIASALLETAGLAALAFSRLDRRNRAAPYVAGVALACLAISSPVLTSADAFFYAYASTLGFQSYRLATVPSGSAFSFLLPNVPLVGNMYGRLWTQVNTLAGSLATTLYGKIIALRVLEALLLVCSAWIVRSMRTPRRAQIAFALNPMIWFYFVLNAHNDFLALVFGFAPIACVRRYPLAATALVAAAGAVKISYC